MDLVNINLNAEQLAKKHCQSSTPISFFACICVELLYWFGIVYGV
jgi:hypothetical protein